jgi:hypothetical protein
VEPIRGMFRLLSIFIAFLQAMEQL